MAMEKAELGLYFRMRAIGESEVAKAFTNVMSGLDRIAGACSRLGGNFKGIDEVLSQVTGGMNLAVGVFQTVQAVLALLTTQTWAHVTALWAQVKATLAAHMATGVGIAVAVAASAAIAGMMVAMGNLEKQTRRTAKTIGTLGDISYKHSVFPGMLDWMKRLRREASKPIVLDFQVRGRRDLEEPSRFVSRLKRMGMA